MTNYKLVWYNTSIGGVKIPVVKIYCLPKGVDENELQEIYETVKKTIVDVKELKITPGQVTVLFIPDLMELGLGDEIIVEIGKLYDKPERTQKVLNQLAEKVGLSLVGFTSSTSTWLWKKPDLIEVFVETFGVPGKKAYWSSKE